MQMRGLSLIAGSLVAIGTGFTAYAALRGGAPEVPAATRTVAVRPVNNRPADAGYAVPGVLDYRSWKPEYDAAPARAPSLYRAALQRNRTFRHAPDAAAMAGASLPPADLSQQAAALQDEAAPAETVTPY